MPASSSSSELSVLVPALNEGVHLRRTVECVRDTLPGRTQVVVVDDGSDDGCADFLRRPGAAATLVERPEAGRRLGVVGARNLAASMATGETLVFLDAHMRMPAGWIDPLVEAANDPQVGAASPAIAVLGRLQSRGYGMRWTDASLSVDWLPSAGDVPYEVPILPGACVAIRRDTFHAVGGFDGGLAQFGLDDAELSFRLWRFGYGLRLVPSVVVEHLFRERHPYPVEWGAVAHNILRVAFLHFGAKRWAAVVEAMKPHACFAAALARVTGGDAPSNREHLRRYTARSDDAYFQRFGDIC